VNANLHPIMAQAVAPFAPKADKATVSIDCFEVDLNTSNDPYYERLVEAPADVVEQAASELLEAHGDELELRVRRLMLKGAA
jgi:pyruvate-formate lyase-activating enzyme